MLQKTVKDAFEYFKRFNYFHIVRFRVTILRYWNVN